jgi:hypothetical protein
VIPDKLPRDHLTQELLSNDELFARSQILHALFQDLAEQVDLAARHPDVLARLADRLARLRGGQLPASASGHVELDADTVNELKAIGYIGD